MLSLIEFLTAQIASLDEEIDGRFSDKSDIIDALGAIPGIGRQSAQAIVAEIGTDMSRFPSAKHLGSWAGLSPGSNESAGKKNAARHEKEIPR
jgi:transposase